MSFSEDYDGSRQDRHTCGRKWLCWWSGAMANLNVSGGNQGWTKKIHNILGAPCAFLNRFCFSVSTE